MSTGKDDTTFVQMCRFGKDLIRESPGCGLFEMHSEAGQRCDFLEEPLNIRGGATAIIDEADCEKRYIPATGDVAWSNAKPRPLCLSRPNKQR